MNVELRVLSLFDTSNIVKWRNSAEVKENLFSQDDITEEQHKAYFKKYIETGKIVQFIIIANGTDCGTSFLKNIDLDQKEAEFGIFIGEAEFRGKGVGKIATQKTISYGFEKLNLKTIYLTVLENNTQAIKSYENAGFKKSRIITDGYVREGKYFNLIEMRKNRV